MIDHWKTRLLLWKFKGGGGGGGNSGRISYPSYMETFHGQLLDDATADALDDSIVDLVNAAVGNSPYSGITAYDPDLALNAMDTAVTDFDLVVDRMEHVDDWEVAATAVNTLVNSTLITAPTLNAATDIASGFIDPTFAADTNRAAGFIDPKPASEDEIVEAVGAHRAIADAQTVSDVLPRFKAGLRDINAVMSSSFTLGQANIEAAVTRDVNKFQGDLRVAAFINKDNIDAESIKLENTMISQAFLQEDQMNAKSNLLENQLIGEAHILGDKSAIEMEKTRRLMVIQSTDKVLTMLGMAVEFKKNVAHYLLESKRLRIVSKMEESDSQLEIDDADGKWDLDTFSYTGNMLAAIGGARGGGGTTPKKQSALGGALSGAGTGAMVGSNPALMAATGGWSLAIGAALGGIGGLLG